MRLLLLGGLIAACLNAQSQEVKVKKGDVLIDGTSQGKLEKSGNIFKGRTYTLKSNDGTVLLVGRQKETASILEKRDQPFLYYSIEIPSQSAKSGLAIDEFPTYGIDDYFVKFFVQNKVFENGKLNEAAVTDFVKAHPDSIPASIIKTIEKEQEYLADMATIVERNKKEQIEIFQLKADSRNFYDKAYKSDNYQILQDKILIGYASILVPDVMGMQTTSPKILFYNVNKTPIARLEMSQLGNLRIYGQNKEVSYNEHKLFAPSYVPKIKIEQAVRFLISKDAI